MNEREDVYDDARRDELEEKYGGDLGWRVITITIECERWESEDGIKNSIVKSLPCDIEDIEVGEFEEAEEGD